MYARHLLIVAAAAAIPASLGAQNLQRRAVITGGGDFNGGKCTVEVVVDGAAEVEVRGDMATLRNISGQQPQWRRFECTGVMPPNPSDFRFAGVDGRGRQELIRDPRNGGTAVVQIEDPEGGSDGYTFNLFWGGNGNFAPQNRYPDQGERRYEHQGDRDQDSYHRDREDWLHQGNWRDRFFERVREDLDHVQSITFPFSGDQFRLARTKQELNELQQAWGSGRVSERELDDVIDAMSRVVQDNRLGGRDRDILTDDLNRMREIRERY